jgi:ABC-type uncharacterized transport system substrate-binding protein
MRNALSLLIATLPAVAAAHPHVFVDSAVTLSLDSQDQITSVTVSWTYDDFTSLLILEDMGLDPDGDGLLTPAETEQLTGFDLIEWPDGFEGDLYLSAHDGPVYLGHPKALSATLRDGRITALHTRTVPDVPADGLTLRQYDPTYYVAYTLSGGVALPAPCRADITPADPAQAEQALKDALDTPPEDQFAVLQLGIHYAEEVRITCDGSS